MIGVVVRDTAVTLRLRFPRTMPGTQGTGTNVLLVRDWQELLLQVLLSERVVSLDLEKEKVVKSVLKAEYALAFRLRLPVLVLLLLRGFTKRNRRRRRRNKLGNRPDVRIEGIQGLGLDPGPYHMTAPVTLQEMTPVL